MGIEMSLPGPIFKLQSTLLNDDKENGKKKVEEERGRESLEHSSSSSQETHFPGFVTTKKFHVNDFLPFPRLCGREVCGFSQTVRPWSESWLGKLLFPNQSKLVFKLISAAHQTLNILFNKVRQRHKRVFVTAANGGFPTECSKLGLPNS